MENIQRNLRINIFNNLGIKEQFTKKIRKYVELNEKESTTH